MPERLFTNMSPVAARFYSRLLNRVLLNSYAVKHGLFDTLFCETDDPEILNRWTQALPIIVSVIQIQTKKSLGDSSSTSI